MADYLFLRMMKRLECTITGRVQGVFYRDFTRAKAREFGIVGTVRNTDDGSVVVIAEGEKENLQKFLVLLEKGSPHSKVEDINTAWLSTTDEFEDFQILL